MASMWRRAMVYLGLVDEPDGEDEPAPAGRAAEPAPNVRPLPREDNPGPPRPSVVRTMPSSQTRPGSTSSSPAGSTTPRR